MNFNEHSALIGQHAFLSPSSYHWLNYTDDKLEEVFRKKQAVEKGTRLHDIACQLIEEGIKLPRSNKTLNMYVNDAIGFRMTPEQPLVFSENCFGTADAIAFKEKDKLLRIHDLKTGTSPVSMKQLYVYAALFCLEYNKNPMDISFVLNIYQNNEIFSENPTGEMILEVMEKIKRSDYIINKIKSEI